MPVTLKDIAKELGVSINTISLALNNSSRVSIETRLRVQEAAKRLHYVPNRAAQSLVTRHSKLVGLIVRGFSNRVLNQVALRLEQLLYQEGYGLVLVDTTPPCSELRALQLLEAQQVEGIFMYPSLPPDKRVVSYIQSLSIPVMMLSYGDYEAFTDCVYVDREKSSYLVTKHLLELGHREIALVCFSGAANNAQLDCERLNGYLRALNEYGLTFNPAYLSSTSRGGYKGGYEAAANLLRRSSVTALYASEDSSAVGAMRYCLERGKRIPQDISIASNDSTDIAAYAAVPITASRYDVETLTQEAMQQMMRRIRSEGTDEPFIKKIDTILDVRESTASIIDTDRCAPGN